MRDIVSIYLWKVPTEYTDSNYKLECGISESKGCNQSTVVTVGKEEAAKAVKGKAVTVAKEKAAKVCKKKTQLDVGGG